MYESLITGAVIGGITGAIIAIISCIIKYLKKSKTPSEQSTPVQPPMPQKNISEIKVPSDFIDEFEDLEGNILAILTESGQITLRGDIITVGRAPDNTVVIENQKVSSHHCRLVRNNGQWLIEDLNSLNGTFVNGIRAVAGAFVPIDKSSVVSLSSDNAQIINFL